MTEPVEAKAEFRTLAEDALRAARHDPDAASPIAVEVARLIIGYKNTFAQHVQRLGPHPDGDSTHKTALAH